jgi:hypothetical protein
MWREARLQVEPLDASKLDEMQEHMQKQAQMMGWQHACPMTAGAEP